LQINLKWYKNATLMEFEFDPNKSVSNRVKHGIDFVQAQAFWAAVGWEQPSPLLHEVRIQRTALLKGKFGPLLIQCAV